MNNPTTANTKTSKIIVTLGLTNWIDAMLAEQGFISAAKIRACTLDNALVDKGTTRLCLPADIIQQLGLKQVAIVDVQTETGIQTSRVYTGLQLTVEGREGRYDCVELPVGQMPLVGFAPLEDLGLEPDFQNQRLRHLPNQGKETYLTV